jgi:hypothetical protein
MKQRDQWNGLSAKFSDKEMIPIKAVQKLYNFNNSQFVRISVLYGTFLLMLQKVLDNPSMSMTKIMEPAVKTIFNEQVQKEIEAELARLKTEIDPKIFGEAQEQMEIINESIKVFWEHNKRGRPARARRKRGRPQDKGVE